MYVALLDRGTAACITCFVILLLSGPKFGAVTFGSEKTRFLAKMMKLQSHITFFLFALRKHQGYDFTSKFDELFEKQHHLSELLN